MKKTFILNLIYIVLLNLVFLYVGEFKLSVASTIFIGVSLAIYTRLLYVFSYKARCVINSLFIIISFIMIIANSLNMYVKGLVLSISQLTLINEFLVIKDVLLQYINIYMILLLLVPVLFIYLGSRFLVGEKVRLVRKEVIAFVALFITINTFAYVDNKLLYATIYSPNEYVEKYGFASYYMRELMPFSKQSLNEEPVNIVQQEKLNDSEFYGMFEDKKNVVFINAESLAFPAIDEELTPTLSKMVNNGMTFENYNSLTYNTNASEFSTLTSTPPPVDNSKVKDYRGEFDSIPKLFENKGYCTFGTHSFRKTFYKRQELYPNLYEFQNSYFYEDLEVNSIDTWMRDEDMFESASYLVEEAGCEKNFTYYMSAYGHSKYEKVHRPGAMEGYAHVKKQYPEYDEYHQMYLSVQRSLDQMLADMEAYYESRGELEDTIFIVVSDHYPYALGETDHKYGEYSQTYVETNFDGTAFETYNVPFFIYDPASTLENRSEYMSNIDILPTIGDLFNLDYTYSYGTSPFRKDHRNQVEWYAQEKFGMLGEGILYTKEDGIIEGEEAEVNRIIDEARERAAIVYSLFE